MPEILIPFKIEDLLLRPELVGRIRLSEDMQQTLAALCGYDDVARRLLRCSKGGVLHTTTPRIDNILHATANQDNYTTQLPNRKTTEVMIMGHPDNTGLVWVKNDETASTANGWPLAANGILNVTVDNLNNLNLLIAVNGEKAIVAYTR